MAKGKPFGGKQAPRFGAHGTSADAPMPGPTANPVPGSPTGRVEYKAGAMQSRRPGGGALGRKTLTVSKGKRGA